MSGFALQKADPAVDRVACQNRDKDDSLQHLNGGVRQTEPALQQAPACADSAEQNCDGNNGQWILPRQEGDQDAGKAVTGGEVGIGAALNRRDFDIPARPADAPARKQIVKISLPTPRPTTLAARMLPPATRAANPNTV